VLSPKSQDQLFAPTLVFVKATTPPLQFGAIILFVNAAVGPGTIFTVSQSLERHVEFATDDMVTV
jgi:hypothetical protein